MADYMAYWKTDQVRVALEDATHGHMVDHAASEQFGKVQSGDTVWIVNIEKGTHRFLLVARIEVGNVVGQREANRVLKARHGDHYDVYGATHHLLAIEGSEEAAREIPLDPVAAQLRFAAPQSRDRLTITEGQVDQQQVRAVRELMPDTIEIFEGLWRSASGRDVRRTSRERPSACSSIATSATVRPVTNALPTTAPCAPYAALTSATSTGIWARVLSTFTTSYPLQRWVGVTASTPSMILCQSAPTAMRCFILAPRHHPSNSCGRSCGSSRR